jgi:phenylacetate-CoA ligase
MDMVYFEKKAYNFITLYYLYRFRWVYKKAQKDPSHWIRVQNKNLKKYVRYIYKMPFYKARFDQVGLKPEDIKTSADLLKLPVLTKTEYRDWINESVAADPEKYKHYKSRTTSGTSGIPLKMYILPRDTASDVANLFRAVYMQDKGYKTFTDKIFSMMIPDANKESLIQKLGILRRMQMSAASDTEKLIEAFNAYKPDFFYGNKSAMQLMATHANKNGITMHRPKCIGSLSEKLDESARMEIEKCFGENVLFDMYGTSEVGNFAIEKVGVPYEHIIWNDTHVVNVVDDEGNPVENGIGRIFVTPLFHLGFPLLNYELNDYVEIKTVDGVKMISRIWGRANDKILNKDGSVYGWMQITRMVSGLVELLQYRIIQDKYDELRVQLVPSSNDEAVRNKITEQLTRIGADMFKAHPKKLIFEWKDKLPPDPNGKVRIIICNVK